MRARAIPGALALLALVSGMTVSASAEETRIRVGAIDAVLTIPPGVERPPVALLIAGSGPTDHDGNGPGIKPATLKKLSEQLAARKIATLRYDKRGAGGWKPEFGRPEDFRFRDYVDDAVALVNDLRSGGKFSKIMLMGHSEGGLVAILTARRASVDGLVLLATASRRTGDVLKEQLARQLPPAALKPVTNAIDAMMAGRIVDPMPPEMPPALAFFPAAQPGIASALVEDPLPPLKLLALPTLIVGGGRDGQVARVDFDGLAAAAPSAKTLWLPNMNHVLNDVGDDADNFAAYNQPDRALNAALIDAVTDFILTGNAR
jgi:uncharacterized protein